MANLGVIGLYDTHPINEFEILAKLEAKGADLDALTQDDLGEFDQDNYGGSAGVEILAQRAGITRDHRVLDVCSGMGGPARWLAHRIGCRVTGIDLTQSRVESAQRLTQRVGLAPLVDFVQGDATAMGLPDASYDVLIGQEAWLHIPTKENLISEITRVVKPGGAIAFTDITSCKSLTPDEQARLASEMHASRIVPAQEYLGLLSNSGCQISAHEDLSAEWTGVLAKRLEMYRSLRETTAEKLGEAHFDKWVSLYTFYAALFGSGKLGGARIVVKRTAN